MVLTPALMKATVTLPWGCHHFALAEACVAYALSSAKGRCHGAGDARMTRSAHDPTRCPAAAVVAMTTVFLSFAA